MLFRSPWRPVVHIEDISAAFLAMLQAPQEKIHNRAFNIGRQEENYRIRDLAEIVKEVVPNCSIEYAADGGPDKRCYRVDFSRVAREVPEFKPKWTARAGAEELYKTYREVGLKLEDFEGPRYMRIDHIRGLLASGKLDATLRLQGHHEAAITQA